MKKSCPIIMKYDRCIASAADTLTAVLHFQAIYGNEHGKSWDPLKAKGFITMFKKGTDLLTWINLNPRIEN